MLRIGSFFEAPRKDLLKNAGKVPWANGPNVSYVQTGRQAIAAIATHYAKEGRDHLLVPGFLCESMLVGFDKQYWNFAFYRVTDRLTIDYDDLFCKISDPDRTVVMTAAYFGSEPTDEHVRLVRRLRKLGTRVVEDETHRVLGALEPLGDVAIASLRKVLPVADGAYIRGGFEVQPSVLRSHTGWQAMQHKSEGDLASAQETYKEASEVLSSWLSPPAVASVRSLDTLFTLNYKELRKRRRENARTLRMAIADIEGLEPVISAEVPSHLVIRISNPKRIQKSLAERGIFCPIHWPQPQCLQGNSWKDDLLSLPVDHRYKRGDMLHIAYQLEAAMER